MPIGTPMPPVPVAKPPPRPTIPAFLQEALAAKAAEAAKEAAERMEGLQSGVKTAEAEAAAAKARAEADAKAQEQALRRGLMRLVNAKLAASMGTWREQAEQQREEKRKLGGALQRMMEQASSKQQ